MLEQTLEQEAGGINSEQMRIHNYVMIFLVHFSLIPAIYWWPETQPIQFFLFIAFSILAMLGINIGFHRYFTHHSFKCKTWFAYVLLILGSMSGSAPLLQWVRTHRCHHQFPDKMGDPHSPIAAAEKYNSKWYGLWHAYIGWIISDFKPNKPLSEPDEK